MNTYNNLESKYSKIIEVLCEIKGIQRGELFKVLKDRECKYLLFLLLKRYRCTDMGIINRDFPLASKNSMTYGLKKAEEKFFVNKEFRDMFFEAEKILDESV